MSIGQMDIGGSIRHFRTEKGLTQRQLAEIVGCTHSMITQMERGTKAGSPQLLGDIAKALGITPNDIYGVTTAP